MGVHVALRGNTRLHQCLYARNRARGIEMLRNSRLTGITVVLSGRRNRFANLSQAKTADDEDSDDANEQGLPNRTGNEPHGPSPLKNRDQ